MKDAERLLELLFCYARENQASGVRDFTEIMYGYRRDVLPTLYDDNRLARTLSGMISLHLQMDPKYQKRLEF